MIENLRDHTLAWIDSIGADGLMNDDEDFIHRDDLGDIALDEFFSISEAVQMVPAYRHADGSYHTEAEEKRLCSNCANGGAMKNYRDEIVGYECEAEDPDVLPSPVTPEKCKYWTAAKDRGVKPEQIVVGE